MSSSSMLAATPSTFERFRRAVNRPSVAILAVGILAAALRFTHVTYPEQRIFDEYYYSKSACIFLGYSNHRCDVNSDDERYWRRERGDVGAWVHPPLGKWAIAVGELAFGTDSFGWRFSSVIFGTASVVLLAGIAQLLFRRPIWTFTAGLLLATESLNFVQSRTSMLDIFVTTWIVAGLLFLVLDKRWMDRRTFGDGDGDGDGMEAGVGAPGAYSRLAAEGAVDASAAGALAGGSGAPSAPTPASGAVSAPTSTPPTASSPSTTRGPNPESGVHRSFPEPLFRPWRIAAGVALGAACASKWSGLTGVAVAILLSVMWERTRRKRFGMAHPVWRTLQAEGFGIVLSLLVLPALVYVGSYVGWFVQNGWDLGAWMRLQGAIASYHEGLKVLDASGKPIHPYLSEAWKWVFLVRPVLYYSRYPGDGVREVIYANGNPAIFWGSLLAVPFAAFRWWRGRDWRAGFVVVAVLGLYVPWMFVSRPQFLFYATPITPFFVLACVYALRDVSEMHVSGSRSRPYLPFVVGFVVLSVGLFVWFWPVLTGGHLSDAAFRLRAWFPTWT